jgi:hypothetical protein
MWWTIVLAFTVAFAAGLVIYFKLPVEKDELAKTISILGACIAAISLFWGAYTFYR